MTHPVITSRANPVFKQLMALHASKGVKKAGAFLAGGDKIVYEILREKPGDIISWIRAPGMPEPPPVRPPIMEIILSRERFNEINLIGTAGPLLGLKTPVIKDFHADEPWPHGCTLFIPFGDPENVGAVIRSASGMGASRVVLLREAACPFLPKAFRASAGAILRMPIEYGPELDNVHSLTGHYPLYALDIHGNKLDATAWPPTFGLIAGMEGKGLPSGTQRWCIPVSIPLCNGLESLNAAAAVSVALWDWRTKQRAAEVQPENPGTP